MSTRYLFLALGLWLSAALLCVSIEKRLSESSFSFTLDNSLHRILGSATEVLGDVLYLEADVYFHGGVPDKFREPGETLRTMTPGEVEEEKEEGPKDWIAKIDGEVASHVHRHLTADKLQELLPFFALSTSLDPHNIEALLTTAFWLDKSFSKSDEAIRVLEKGVKENPASWELESELGLLYLQRKKDAAQSRRHTLEALRKSVGQDLEKFQRFDLYYFLGQACELEGRKAEALAAYREGLKYFDPKNPPALQAILLKRIEALSV